MTQPDLLLGKTLQGRYTIVRLIAHGGMGSVYRAVQPHEPRQVAIKVLHTRTTEDPTMFARFQREAEATMRIDHPNAVRVFTHGTEGDCAFLVMELVEGESLNARLSRQGKLTPTEAVDLLAPICEALAAAHATGVIHRDLKPENVMLGADPSAPGGVRVKLLDFGLAKPIADAPGAGLTALGSVVGTPPYMAPEQIAGRQVGTATDVYAAGVLLYQLVTGALPHHDEDPYKSCWLRLHTDPRRPRELVPALPEALERVIMAALSRKPEDRPSSALALRDRLREALAAIPAPVKPLVIPEAVQVVVEAEVDECMETMRAEWPDAMPREAPLYARKIVVVPPALMEQARVKPVPTLAVATQQKRGVLRSPVTAIATGMVLAFGLAALALPLLLH